MRTLTRLLAVVAVTSVCACDGGDATEPSREYIAGEYAGTVVDLSEGIWLHGTFTVNIMQNGVSLIGSYAVTGTLNDGIVDYPLAEAGTLSGTIAAGTDPSVDVTVTPAACPARKVMFSGAYDSANQTLTLAGPFELTDQSCAVYLTYQLSVLLAK